MFDVADSQSEDLDLLRDLAEHGFVKQHNQTGVSGTRWQFTAKALQHISLARQLVSSSPVSVPRGGVALTDMTTWEMLSSLDVVGWKLLRHPPARSAAHLARTDQVVRRSGILQAWIWCGNIPTCSDWLLPMI